MNHARPELPERPKATTFTVEEILHEAGAGRLRVPRFQTGLRWGAKEVVALFDSILRGFPIGSLLLWDKAAEADQLTFGPAVHIDATEVATAHFIVDGQQRITALVGSLSREDDEPVGDTHAVWIDLQTGSFRRPLRRSEVEFGWVPVCLFGDRHRLLQWSRKQSDPDLIDHAFEIEARLMKYPIPAYIVRDASQQALRQIFSRTNASGVPLKEADVFQALFGDEEEPRPIEAIARALNEATGFGALPEHWLLRCVKAVGEISPKREFSESLQPESALLERTKSGLLRAIKFLQAETPFLHSNLLPYRFPLIVLAKYFDGHPEPEARNRTLLARWVWRGAVSAQHAGSDQGTVAAHLADLGQDESGSVQRLLKRPQRHAQVPDPLSTWNSRGAVTRLYAAIMLAAEPRDPVTEEPVTPELVVELLQRYSLSDLFVRIIPERIEVANRVFLSPGRDLRQLLGAPSDVLRSHVLDSELLGRLDGFEEAAFVEGRAAQLSQLMQQTLKRAADGRADRDRPPIADILVAANGP